MTSPGQGPGCPGTARQRPPSVTAVGLSLCNVSFRCAMRAEERLPDSVHAAHPGRSKLPMTWSPVTESNRRPSPYHGDALPTELTGPIFTCLTCHFAVSARRSGRTYRRHSVESSISAGLERAASVAELSVLPPSWRLHLEAANLSPRTIRAYTDDAAPFVAFPGLPGHAHRGGQHPPGARRGVSRPSLSAPRRRLPPHATGPFSSCLAGRTRRARSTGHRWPRRARRRSPRNRSPCFPMRTSGACWPTAQGRTSATGGT